MNFDDSSPSSPQSARWPRRPRRPRSTLRVVMHSDLKIVEPLDTAYIVRSHGYLNYDTLFSMDAKGDIKPQMVDKYEVSKDQLTTR